MKKKEKKEKKKPSMNSFENYEIYSMNMQERATGFLLGFLIGAIVFYVFFQFIIISVIVGVVAGIIGEKIYKERRKKLRQKNLLIQFRDLMESLVSSYSVGRNTREAFRDSYQDLQKIYGEEADIVKEIKWILAGLQNQMKIENMLEDFGKRSGIEDISNFAMIFAVKGEGVDLKSLVAETREIISEKIEIEMEIETLISSEKNELYIMLVMPVLVMLAFSGFSGEIMVNSPENLIVKIIAIAIFAFSYFIGCKIMDIKV